MPLAHQNEVDCVHNGNHWFRSQNEPKASTQAQQSALTARGCQTSPQTPFIVFKGGYTCERARACAYGNSRILGEALAQGQEQPGTRASGRTDRRQVGQTDGQTNGRKHEWADGWSYGRLGGQVIGRTTGAYGRLDGQLIGQTTGDRRTVGRTVGRTASRTEGPTDGRHGRTDGWSDGRSD